ncbi:MAG: ABC transporter permease, partial [Pseudorhodobacter sp.]
MADATTELLTTADGRPLKEALAIAQSRAKRRAFLLVLPLLLFVLLTFLIPIGYMLKRSVEHDGFAKSAPALVEWFTANPGFDYANPPEEAYAALVKDLAFMQAEKLTGISGTRINYTVPGTISLFKKGAREAADLQPPYKEALLAVDPEWGRPALWRGMEAASSKYTTEFYKVAADRKLTDEGWQAGSDKDRIYLYLFFKTFLVSGIITVICLLLAFPVAHLLAVLPMSKSSLLMILVLLPFWTSLLVRTTSWIALLQEQGIVNDLLVWVGFVADGSRLTM